MADELKEEKAMSDWQDISTAPRDTRIQLLRRISDKYVNLDKIAWIKIGKWSKHYRDGYKEAWRESGVGVHTEHLPLAPTHWQPLPPPPDS